VVFAMGRERQLPSVLARIHPRYHTPYVGMVFTAILSLAGGAVHEEPSSTTSRPS